MFDSVKAKVLADEAAVKGYLLSHRKAFFLALGIFLAGMLVGGLLAAIHG